MKILIIEDEHHIAQTIKEGLQQESYSADICYDAADGYHAASSKSYDAIILDVMLSGDGAAVCSRLRAAGIHTPILMVSIRNQDVAITQGLAAGADDYLAKPFSFEVLLARMRSLLGKTDQDQPEVLEAADLTLDRASHRVSRGGRTIALSGKEYAILEYLLRNRGTVLSKRTIMSRIWDFDANILPNNVEVFVAYLRAKIDKPFKGPRLIRTVRGFGYTIDA